MKNLRVLNFFGLFLFLKCFVCRKRFRGDGNTEITDNDIDNEDVDLDDDRKIKIKSPGMIY